MWSLCGPRAVDFALVNEFLAYLADRNFSPRTGRVYAYDLLAFARWLVEIDVLLSDVDVDVMLRFLTACREATPQGRPGGNVYPIRDGRNTGYAPATINRRLAAISSLFAFREMREPGAASPVPPGRAARTRASGERFGLLGHVGKPKPRSKLRVREPRLLPRGLSREESTALLGSFRTWRDRAIGGADAAVRPALGRGAHLASPTSTLPVAGSESTARAARNVRCRSTPTSLARSRPTYWSSGRTPTAACCSWWRRVRTGGSSSRPRGCGQCSAITANGLA